MDKRNELRARGVDVTHVVDHDWAKSIYFKDRNGIQLEYGCLTRDLNADDAGMQYRLRSEAGNDAESALNADEPVNALWPWK